MRPAYLFLACLITGCATLDFNRPESISSRPYPEWSKRDCMTLLLAAVQHNYRDPAKPSTGVCVIPYTPTVVFSLNRMAQEKNRWSDKAFREKTDVLLREMSGVYADWEHGARIYDADLRPLNDAAQLDSLTFVVILTNNTWPCVPPLQIFGGRAMEPLMMAGDWPCDIPELNGLDEKIRLVNDRGDSVKPTFVWGRHHDMLTTDETLFVRFPLRDGARQLLEKSKKVSFVIAGFEQPICLEFEVASLR